jgi:plastocyanin
MKHSYRMLSVSVALAGLFGCGDDQASPDVPPAAASVSVGNVFFQSVRNGSRNPAVDTVAGGGTVTWSWSEPGTHGVHFQGEPFPDGPDLSDAGSEYSLAFPTPGSYTYDCTIHGDLMTGTIVVR